MAAFPLVDWRSDEATSGAGGEEELTTEKEIVCFIVKCKWTHVL